MSTSYHTATAWYPNHNSHYHISCQNNIYSISIPHPHHNHITPESHLHHIHILSVTSYPQHNHMYLCIGIFFMYYVLHTPSVVMNSSYSWLGVCGTWCVGGLVSLHAMFMTKCGSYPITVNWTQILICTILSGLSFSCPFWATIIFIVVGFCHVESFKPCIAVYFCTFLVPCF